MGLYESMSNEVITLEQGQRVTNNHIAARIAELSGHRGDGIFAIQSLMFAQVCNGLRPYRKKCPKKWFPNPAVLRDRG